jgi:hypothetical protein
MSLSKQDLETIRREIRDCALFDRPIVSEAPLPSDTYAERTVLSSAYEGDLFPLFPNRWPDAWLVQDGDLRLISFSVCGR